MFFLCIRRNDWRKANSEYTLKHIDFNTAENWPVIYKINTYRINFIFFFYSKLRLILKNTINGRNKTVIDNV